MALKKVTTLAARFCKFLRGRLHPSSRPSTDGGVAPADQGAATVLGCSGPDAESALENALNELLEMRLSGLGVSERAFSFCFVDLDG